MDRRVGSMVERRIAPPREFEDLLTRLSEPVEDGGFGVFETKQKALMFAAALGYHRGAFAPLEKRGEGIRFDIFQGALDDGFIDALALHHSKDLNILASENAERRLEIFESYVHGGLEELRRVCELEGEPLENLVRLMDEARRPPEPAEIPGIDPEVLRGLMG